MAVLFRIGVILSILLASHGGATELGPLPAHIATLVKPTVLKEVIDDRTVMAHAQLENYSSGQDSIKKYSYYAIMLVHNSLAQTRKIMIDYHLYPKMIPYVDRADYTQATRTLEIEGGIWMFKLVSSVFFEERGDRWIHYSIIRGHFQGLSGDLFFESLGEKGTLVFLRGEILGQKWPPTFVIERGAEIIFSFTGKRMRSFIESLKFEGANHDPEIPRPQRRLR